MPELTTVNGVRICIYFDEAEHKHNRPHFHAIYQDYKASFDIETGKLLSGRLPPSKESKVRKWYKAHKDELAEIWSSQDFRKLSPDY